MLRHVDSDEIGEWIAYERAFGPLDSKWQDGALIAIYEQLQLANRISAARVMDVDDIPDPVSLHPPTEFYRKPEDVGLPDEDEDSDDEWDDNE